MAAPTNFDDLVAKYRFSGAATAGYEFLNLFINRYGDEDVSLGMMTEAWVMGQFEPDKRRLGIDPEIFSDSSSPVPIRPVSALMDFYSILEIASSANYIGPDLGPVKEEALRILDYGPVKTYCFDVYRSVLPLQLLARLKQTADLQNQYDPDIAYPLFLKFVNLADFLQETPEIRAFFGLNDDRLDEFFGLFKSPDEKEFLLEEFYSGENMEGFQCYLSFLEMFDGLMSDAAGIPELQSAFVQFMLKWTDMEEFPVKNIVVQSRKLFDYLEEFSGDIAFDSPEDFKMEIVRIMRLNAIFGRVENYINVFSSLTVRV